MNFFRLIPVALLWLACGQILAASPATAPVREAGAGDVYIAEASVEAVRQSVISSQIAGRITHLAVKAGERISKGQVLVRIDREIAVQQASATQAQVVAAQAQLDVARRELQRQQQLFARQFISQAALDQAQAQFKATEAAVRGTLAQAGAAQTQTGFYTITAPFSGVVAEVPVAEGDMALPGKPLLTLYDPGEMRVVAPLPQSKLAQLPAKAEIRLEFPSLPETARWLKATTLQALPVVDPASHTVTIRLGLPNGGGTLAPGLFVRAWFPVSGEARSRLMIPQAAVLVRSELVAVYVIDAQGKSQLRQIRLGKPAGTEVEVLAGLKAGERVALDPVAAARIR
jgi:RND family efflux transporter MFP subunit